MLGIPSNRKSFIESSIELARCYFQGIDLLWPWLNTALDMINMEKLLDECYLNTDYGIRQWLNYSFPASKLVLGLPYHGYAWIVAKNLKTLHLALLDACSRQMSTSTSAVDSDAPNLKVRRFSSLKAATNNFSSEDKEREVPSYCIAYNKDKDKVMCE
ncbi:class V chitinase-like [Malus domestica]|uniref:class V chitinase-like n=1 Tax=Malus domestica TaxID=3750 RepID=UPI003976D9EC